MLPSACHCYRANLLAISRKSVDPALPALLPPNTALPLSFLCRGGMRLG
jgi:hypothetical protein